MQDTWKLNFRDLYWEQVDTPAPLPLPRHSMGFASVSMESRSKIVMFGGCPNDKGTALGDLIIFDARTEVWTEVQPTSASDKPVARYDMGFAAGATGKIYLVGGKLSKWTTVNSQV
jgi:hypothetical protein